MVVNLAMLLHNKLCPVCGSPLIEAQWHEDLWWKLTFACGTEVLAHHNGKEIISHHSQYCAADEELEDFDEIVEE